MRMPINASIFGESAIPAQPNKDIAIADIYVTRRPHKSESEPHTSGTIACTALYAVTATLTTVAVVLNSYFR